MDLTGSRKDAGHGGDSNGGRGPVERGRGQDPERMCELDANRGAAWEACRGVMARVTGQERSAGSAYRIVWAQHKSGRTSPPTTGEPQEARGP